jgi:predicted metal-binding protein
MNTREELGALFAKRGYSDYHWVEPKRIVYLDRPEDRAPWSRELIQALLDLEREVFLVGYEKALVLLMDTCRICADCTNVKEECTSPGMARPTPRRWPWMCSQQSGRTGTPLGFLRGTNSP